MANNDLTIFQKLTQAFGFQGQMKNTEPPSFNFNKDELLKTDSREDYEKALLQAQQSQYIADKWSKLDQSLYNQSVYYEPNRISAYYDYESMEFSISADTQIATPDGFISIKELADKGRDYEFITYAYDHNLKKVVLAKARNAHYTRDEMTYKITFDDGTSIRATYGHRFLKRDGVFVKVEDLKPGDSMMPFYRKSFYNNQNYHWVYACNSTEGHHGWVSEHNLVAEWFYDTKIKENEEVHHIDFRHIPWDLIIVTAQKYRTMQTTSDALGVSMSKLSSTLRMGGFKNWGMFLEAYGMKKSKAGRHKSTEPVINHKIVSIEPYGIEPVYDLTVPGYKNFATDTIFSHNTPEISAALDIYAEESTTMSEKGQILSIYSESKRIKGILDDLFYETLDINTNLQMWARGMCKYGDDFVYLKVDPQKGIIGCQQLPNIEIERIEGASSKTPNMGTANFKVPTRELRFAWKNKDMEFQSWEIAHFRILGDDRKLPYGTSMLDKVRRIWKQLLLAEDAMLIYRTSRAPERRVFKVFVGNMDDKDIEPYVQRVANKFKRDQVVDQTNGQVDMRYNQMAVDQDFFIPVRDPNQASPIETLPGAQNLGEIADIEYIQKKLLAALRIPKAFIGFEEVVGDGKNLALMDIRFSRTINKVQTSLVQELNKIALIHLYLMGLEDELHNFNLSLTNPSSQSDLLKIEQWKDKITLYKDATSDQSNMGILPVSHTWAKKNILGFSDSEVIFDLQQQRMERAIGFELTQTQQIIKRSGIFDEVDKKYGIPEEEREKLQASGAATTPPEGGVGGADDFGSPGESTPPSGPEPGGSLSESKNNIRKDKIFSMLNDDTTLDDLFDFDKAQQNIYEIDNKIKDILND